MLTAFDNGRLFGASSGPGVPWVLALHGWQRTHRDFARVLDGVGAIALDLPGFGASPAPERPWGAAEYAEAVLPVLDRFDGPAVVLGHSFGGRVAVLLAAAHPECVGALVLTGVPLLRPAGTGRAKVARPYRAARFLHARGLLSEQRMEALRQRYGSQDYRKATGVMRAIHVIAVNETYEQELAELRCPVDLVWGAEDTAAPVAVAEQAAALVADAEITVLPGVGHLTPLEAPDALAAALRRRQPA